MQYQVSRLEYPYVRILKANLSLHFSTPQLKLLIHHGKSVRSQVQANPEQIQSKSRASPELYSILLMKGMSLVIIGIVLILLPPRCSFDLDAVPLHTSFLISPCSCCPSSHLLPRVVSLMFSVLMDSVLQDRPPQFGSAFSIWFPLLYLATPSPLVSGVPYAGCGVCNSIPVCWPPKYPCC